MKEEHTERTPLSFIWPSQLPTGAQVLNSHWIFADKTTEQEIFYKARWVINGNEQILDEAFSNTFAPTPSSTCIRTMIAWGHQNGYTMCSADVECAFQHPELPPEEVVYTRPPTGFDILCKWMGWTEYREGMLLKWVKAVYGLKGAM